MIRWGQSKVAGAEKPGTEGGIKMKTNLEKAIKRVAQESPSVKTLLALQRAYLEARRLLQKDQVSLDVVVACDYAIKSHVIAMADRASLDQPFIDMLKSAEIPDFPWHEALYVLMDKIPTLDNLVTKYTIEAEEEGR